MTTKSIDDLTESDLLECPIHYQIPVHEYTKTDHWCGYQTYCPRCKRLFDLIYGYGENRRGLYFHHLWQLAQINYGSKQGSILCWNNNVEHVLKYADPIEVLKLDIMRTEYENL